MRKIKIDLPANYEIRFANNEDVTSIMMFIKKHWKEDHIFAKNEQYFRYEFCNNHETCFVILINPQKEITGILGYIPYDQKSTDRNIFTVMWKVIESEFMFAGIALFYYLLEHSCCKHIFTSGLNQETINIYKYIGLQIDKMQHFFILNAAVSPQIVAYTMNYNCKSEIKADNSIRLRLIEGEKELEAIFPKVIQNNIYKSLDYLVHRYMRNPIYKYDLFLAEDITRNHMALIVTRNQTYNKAIGLRMIDAIGDLEVVYKLPYYIKKYIMEKGIEYADLYAYGLDCDLMRTNGWEIIMEGSEIIVPDYFNPYVKENRDIYIMKEKDIDVVIFKGDGDQDRPS